MKRVWHPWELWESYPAGFYGTADDPDAARLAYRDFLADSDRFDSAVTRVFAEWPIASEHFLTNEDTNRLAWIGQAAMCIATGTPSAYRGGFKMLSTSQQRAANMIAETRLKEWEREHKRASRFLHRNVEGQRLSAGHTGRSSSAFDEARDSAIVQGDMFRTTEQ